MGEGEFASRQQSRTFVLRFYTTVSTVVLDLVPILGLFLSNLAFTNQRHFCDYIRDAASGPKIFLAPK